MPPKLLTRPARVKPQAKSQTNPKQKGKSKSKAVVEAPRTTQEIVLTQEQSFELVKIGVNAAVSQFVFCRKFFPSNCYKTRIYDASDPGLTYDTFINGTNIPKNLNLNEAGDEIISFNSIVRGTGHKGVEKLLDWLELGVANAVNDKCLAKFQLSVYRKEVIPEQLVEALTINFTYKGTGSNSRVQVSASMSDKAGKVINLVHAQEGLRDLIVQVMNACRNVRGQSAGRKVSMQLLYNENARPKNEYRGFRAASTSQFLPDGCGLPIGEMNNSLNGLAIEYYTSPAIKLIPDQKRSATIRGLKPTPSRVVTENNSPSSLRESQSSQIDGSQQRSTMQWLNEIGHTRGPNDIDTQLRASQPLCFGKHTSFIEQKELDKEVEEEEEEEEEVRCECTNFDDRENLIQCGNCKNFCHSQCYGYSKGNAKIGANFECYECLLAESEQSILFQKMYPLCIRRRMVYYLEKYGFNDMEGLCQYMNLNQKETQALVESLNTEGIIKKCSKSSKEPFRFVNLDKLRGELFDPSKHIAHTKLFGTEATEVEQTQLTPDARRFRQSHDGSVRAFQSEGSSTQTPSSWRSLHNETLRRSPQVPAQTQSTPQNPNKRAGDEISSDAFKKRRTALAATSPFSLRSNSSH